MGLVRPCDDPRFCKALDFHAPRTKRGRKRTRTTTPRNSPERSPRPCSSPRFPLVGFTQTQLLYVEVPDKEAFDYDNMYEVVTDCIFMYRDRKMYHIFLECRDYHRVTVWGYTRGCRDHDDFLTRVHAVQEELAANDDARHTMLFPWSAADARWKRARLAVHALVQGATQFPWQGALTVLEQPAMSMRAFAALPPHRLKWVRKNSNLRPAQMNEAMQGPYCWDRRQSTDEDGEEWTQ